MNGHIVPYGVGRPLDIALLQRVVARAQRALENFRGRGPRRHYRAEFLAFLAFCYQNQHYFQALERGVNQHIDHYVGIAQNYVNGIRQLAMPPRQFLIQAAQSVVQALQTLQGRLPSLEDALPFPKRLRISMDANPNPHGEPMDLDWEAKSSRMSPVHGIWLNQWDRKKSRRFRNYPRKSMINKHKAYSFIKNEFN